MNQAPNKKRLLPIIIVFAIFIILISIFHNSLILWGFDILFLNMANTVLLLLSFLSFVVLVKGVSSPNPHAFVRGLYSSLLLKLFVIVGAILIYVLVFGNELNKWSLFASMVMYIVYTSVEVIQLMKIARKKSDA